MGLTYEQAKSLGLAHLHPSSSGQSDADLLRERFGITEDVPVSQAPQDPMNKTERLFSDELDCMRSRGEILEWGFEEQKFRMADRTWWTPDFRVVLPNHQIIFVEVKVTGKDGAMRWTDDGAVKAKTVPELHPYAFFLAVRTRHRWHVRRLPSRNYGNIQVDLDWRRIEEF